MNCPECKQPMENLGNISGVVYTSCPEQWDEVRICRPCKIKVLVRCYGLSRVDVSFLDSFEWRKAK